MSRQGEYLLGALLSLGTMAQLARGEELPTAAGESRQATEPDEQLLLFLGSVDAEADDGSWLEYLEQTDIEKVAQQAKPQASTLR
ncbi:MAG: hypothetical protein R3E77_16030 [Steroidobacteraceae bacterium]